MTEVRQGPTPRVRFREVSVKRDLTVYGFIFCFVSVSEGKRAGGVAAVWVARNRFAVLDRTHTVS